MNENINFQNINLKNTNLQNQNIDNKNIDEKGKGLSLFDLVVAFLILALVVVIFVPIIYIRNEIYYISRDIEELRVKHSVLVEENKDLENKIESLKFKYEIIDPLSVEFENE
ncbi:hypothetical protein [Campylobacter ureolyticus]|uniref:hypothetical protein n=1 Tax=Campylobacter ureolyticus TaxID=827 RepID=UPI0022B4CAAA|nr:hypothetical protein [Campylobacter ureolyticus]MCZ6110727.1 hypothetical protein [Campylobacter ureolyticus]MDK8322948.1 hypothetical protein [Campylobacter ureolyticus]